VWHKSHTWRQYFTPESGVQSRGNRALKQNVFESRLRFLLANRAGLCDCESSAREMQMGKAKIADTIRAKVLARDSYVCRACGFGGSANYAFALDCDHIVAEKNGGATTLENLQCLCKGCNIAKTGNNWEFAARTQPVAESVWAVNQKIVNVAFTVGLKEGSVGKTLKRLK
jgi:hypothetical protein